MKTAVVILNWNTEAYLRSFLPPLLESLPEDASVIVADNGSTDGSREVLKELFPQVRSILLDKNYGFTGGYDRAIGMLLEEEESPEYVLLLNSDILVSGDWLQPLTQWMDSHPQCGACGPKLHALEPDGKGGWIKTGRFEYAGAAGGLLDRFGYPYCRGRVLKMVEQDFGQYDSPKDVLWVSGACLMVRSSVWKELGGLDDRFFAHMEEIDLCWRMQLRGWSVSVVPDSVVWHLGGGSLPKDSPWKLRRNYCNNLLMLEKNLPDSFRARNPRLSAERCRRKASVRIFQRKCLDLVAALVYCLQGHPEYAAAVRDGHREYRKLRTEPQGNPLAKVRDTDASCRSARYGAPAEGSSSRYGVSAPECAPSAPTCAPCPPAGLTPLFLLAAYYTRGKDIFRYLKETKKYL